MKSWLRGKGKGLFAFGVICALVVGGLGWVTVTVLRLEEQQHRGDFEKEQSGQLRVAMWRLDSAVAADLAREDRRPYNHYSALSAPPLMFRNDGQPFDAGMVLEPSPLLSAELPEWMLLHFQTDPSDADPWSSPQVLPRRLGEVLNTPKAKVALGNVTEQRHRLLTELAGTCTQQALLDGVEQRGFTLAATDTTLVPANPGNPALAQQQIDLRQAPNTAQGLEANSYSAQQPKTSQSFNNLRNGNENDAQQRAQMQERIKKEMGNKNTTEDWNVALWNLNRNGANWIAPNPARPRKTQQTVVNLGSMAPFWLKLEGKGELLVMARLVEVGEKRICQGIVLDWPNLQARLSEVVGDLYPEAEFVPVRAKEPSNPERTMYWLPIEMNPGSVTPPPMPTWTPLRSGLALAWVAALAALLTVGLGGWSLIDLSERRIRFVSAVTHELRTPLTTLRLYLDMLTGGLVSDEEHKKEYLETLHSETERLNRLVANVLDFSRLENQRPRLEKTPVVLPELLEQVRSDWHARCQSTEKELIVENSAGEGAQVVTDVKLVQQVLGNLIDNACKYSRGAEDRRIWLRARRAGPQQVVLEVEDRGPGVAPRERGSIFRPFRRGRDADVTAGGVGLGLALARRWAALLGGRLALGQAREGSGACFRLELPVKSSVAQGEAGTAPATQFDTNPKNA